MRSWISVIVPVFMVAGAACGGGSTGGATATDAGRADAAVPQSDAATQPDPPADYPPIGAGGSDTTGSCRVPNTDALIQGSRACVDYDMGFAGDGMTMDCTSRSGNYAMNEACNITNRTYVAGCVVTDGGNQSHLRFYRRNNDIAVTASQVQAYCTSINAMYDGPSVPQNTGNCRANPTALIQGNDNVRACTNYDTGYLDAAAMNACTEGTYTTGETCLTTGAVAGCQITAQGQTRTVWFYVRNRGGGAALTTDDVTTYCNSVSGTVVTPS